MLFWSGNEYYFEVVLRLKKTHFFVRIYKQNLIHPVVMVLFFLLKVHDGAGCSKSGTSNLVFFLVSCQKDEFYILEVNQSEGS